MKHVLIICISVLAMSQSAMAATWHYTPVASNDASYYFDADTVVKTPDSVDVWFKTVQKRVADSDGSWARAIRFRFFCSKRTSGAVQWSTYDKNNEFIKAGSSKSDATGDAPGSIGEGMLKMACAAGFPKKPHPDTYAPVSSNDIFEFTRLVTERIDSRKDEAPK